jgi:diphosphomevalonate decarboxylase
MTLSQSFTEVSLEFFEKKTKELIELNYFFEDKKNELFENRIQKYLSDQIAYFPFLKEVGISIHSHNSFPHSAGIASSASAFGAIALALSDATHLFGKTKESANFLQRASLLARLGSGSACRSMFPNYALWGNNIDIPNSSDEFAIPVENVHENFAQMCDTILIVDENPKKVSSSKGHSLMNHHSYANQRFMQANQRTSRLVHILRKGDYEEFIHIAESEALTLHAMMMTSEDYFILMKPETLTVIDKVISFRKDTKIPLCFTLDAGPNVHLLYPNLNSKAVEDFINDELKNNLKEIIWDRIGNGPEKIN